MSARTRAALAVTALAAGLGIGALNELLLAPYILPSAKGGGTVPPLTMLQQVFTKAPGTGAYFLLVPIALSALVAAVLIRRRPATGVPSAEEGPASAPAASREERADSAVRLLALFQEEGRLIDFLLEDLDAYDDAQVGAAVRTIHAGCRKVLSDRIQIERIYGEEDGTTVEVPAGFDPRAVRLTGNVHGAPPFRGTLRHAGWRVVRLDLPTTSGAGADRIVAPAEVEIP